MVPSGLLGVPTGGPTATQGDLYNAIVGMGWAPQGYGPIPVPQAAQAPTPDPSYDKWGHVTTGSPQGQMPQAQVPSLNVGPGLAAAAPGTITPGASGYDMWGRQAPAPAQQAPQLPGLADIMKLIQAYQAQQALNANAPQGLLGGDHSEGGGGGAEGTM
jgi:hypothetical protein